MYVGNLEAYQGVDLLLEAFAVAVGRGKDVVLVVVGGKPRDVEAYREKAEQRGIAVAHATSSAPGRLPRWAAWSRPPTSWCLRGSRA